MTKFDDSKSQNKLNGSGSHEIHSNVQINNEALVYDQVGTELVHIYEKIDLNQPQKNVKIDLIEEIKLKQAKEGEYVQMTMPTDEEFSDLEVEAVQSVADENHYMAMDLFKIKCDNS